MFSTVDEGMSQAYGKHSSALELVLVMNCAFRAQFIALPTKSHRENFMWQIKSLIISGKLFSSCGIRGDMKSFLDKLNEACLSHKYLSMSKK